jgi:hypothetical protein
MGIEPDLVNRRKYRVEKAGSQINESIGSKKASSDRGLPLQPVKLDRRLKRQQRQHSPSSSIHLLISFPFSIT